MGRVARRKVLRDLWLARGRTAVLVFAMAVSLIAVEAVLGAYGILVREMPRSFLSSSPASATLVVDRGVDPSLLDAVRRRPGFVAEDFEAMRVETVTPIDGAWPPPEGAMLLDRTSLPLLKTRVGAAMTVSTANGRPRSVQVAGVVFDGGVAPAWQEQTGSVYVTATTLALLGEPADLDLLKVVVRDGPLDASAIERTAQDLSAWLVEEGVAVDEIRIPPPSQHPHQALMNALALVLLLFSLLALALSSGLNVAAASERQLASGEATLGYDLELSLSQPQPTESLLRLVRGVPGVAYAEPVGIATVAAVRPSEAPVARTHKDGSHGALRLYALAPETRFQPAVEFGRWLEPGDVDAIVVAPGEHEGVEATVGDTVSLSLAGRTTVWRVVGVMPSVRGPGGGSAGLYVSDAGFAQATGRVGTTQAVRIITAEHDAAARQEALRTLERALAAEGIGVAGVDADWRNTVLRAHMAIVQGALQSLGLVLGVVGALTLASAMSLSVVERTREFGVMQTLGATPARVIWVVVAEALFVGGLSWLAALALALLLSSLVGALVGSALFGGSLPLVVSPVALLAWLAVALLGSAAASAFPASAASRLTIRETLAYA